eukprot:c25295_g5_i1 orf=501-1724(-)
MGVCMSSSIVDGMLLEEGGFKSKLKRKFAPNLLEAGQHGGAEPDEDGIPTRLCTTGITKSCCAYTKQGRKGINQDCFLVWEGCGAQGDATFCGVFDGHGPMGHHVAKEVRDCLPSLLLDVKHSCVIKHPFNGDGPDEHMQSAVLDEDASALLKDAYTERYCKMDEKLKTHPQLNCTCSGTTAVTFLIQNKDLVIANVGDSRAIMVSRREDATLWVDQLTVDFKPNLPGELERIRDCKGRVFALEDEPQVARVWLPHENRPGLAMARALGDFCLKEYGLSAIPHVSYKRLTEHDEFIVLATDGVWDVLTNEEVASIVDRAEPKGGAAKSVVDAAVKKWKRKFSHVRMDDCAVVCHFFNTKHTLMLSSTHHCKPHSSSSLKEQSVGSTLLSYNTTPIKNVVVPCLDRGI